MLIYLAHPIDRRKNKMKDQLDQKIETIRHSIIDSQHHVYHPGGAFAVGRKAQVDWTIEHINRNAQETADAILVVLPKDSTTWGVPVEIERARHLKQPVAIISDSDPTWSMPVADPMVKWFYPDAGNNKKAIDWLDKMHTPRRRDLNVIKWTSLAENGKKPRRAYTDDAGFDLYVSQEITIPPQKFMDVRTDVAMELPADSWGMLTGRSSTIRSRGLLVNQGIIDPGYRGELYIGCWNLSNNPVTLQPGDRIGQIIIISNRTATITLVETEQLTDHPRGINGFGSTGE